LSPVIQDDPLLYAFDCESDDETVDGQEETETIERLKELVTISEKKNAVLIDGFQQYKEDVKATFMTKDNRESLAGSENEVVPKLDDEEIPMDYYFGSYAETEIHETMLKDSIRTEAYRDFIYHNKHYFKNKIVLDVGCGTGILSMFAAKSGAKHVYAVDNSNIILKAREIAKVNELDHNITFIQGRIEQIILPVDNVDIIVSEWMGYFLLFEGMLDCVLYARDKWLAPGGIMAPSRSTVLLAAVENEEWYNEKYHFWNDVYGFKMPIMKNNFLRDAQVDFVDPATIVSTHAMVKVYSVLT
jgi:protein arginine N-methyltransferase 3